MYSLSIIDRFPEIRALVVGDLMLDVYEFCLTSESKPIPSEKPGKLAYKAQKAIEVLGGAGNVAANLASLGVKTKLICITGNDADYFKVRELSEQSGIDHFIVRDASRPTTSKTRIFVDREYLLRRDNEESHPVDSETAATLLNAALHQLLQVDVVILSDYNKGFFNAPIAREIIKECNIHKIPVIVDFKPVNAGFFSEAGIICPNLLEAKTILPDFEINHLNESLKKLHQILKCRSTVVTLGENGICGTDGDSFFHIPGNKVSATDAVGCGDTVRACLALGVSLGLTLAESAALANDAAGVVAQKLATSTINPEELRNFVQSKETVSKTHTH